MLPIGLFLCGHADLKTLVTEDMLCCVFEDAFTNFVLHLFTGSIQLPHSGIVWAPVPFVPCGSHCYSFLRLLVTRPKDLTRNTRMQ